MSPEAHLSEMATLWSVVREAHEGPEDAKANARSELIDRYGGAIQRYLHKVARNAEAGDDLFQEFALRFVKGDLHRASPEKGRFRDYLKTVLYHLVADHHAKKKRDWIALGSQLPEPAVEAATIAEMDRELTKSWRDELLARAWKRLEAVQEETRQPFHSVLRFRAEHPEMRSPEMAKELTAQLGKPLNATGVRQTLHRARTKFAEMLYDEVRQSLDQPTQEQMDEELADLGLMEYCKPILEKQ